MCNFRKLTTAFVLASVLALAAPAASADVNLGVPLPHGAQNLANEGLICEALVSAWLWFENSRGQGEKESPGRAQIRERIEQAMVANDCPLELLDPFRD